MNNMLLTSRQVKPADTIVEINSAAGKVKIGEGTLTIIAGPCAVESEDSYLKTSELVRARGAHILRGGAFKPRTSPYSFLGLGEPALDILAEAKRRTGLPVVTEVLDVRVLDRTLQVADLIQIGSRNMQNFSLLQEVGKLKVPVILKRGFAATVEEWLLAAEYILSTGNERVILCERGIRTFESSTRNTVDIGVIPLIKELSHLPIIIDPSHATGKWNLIRPVSKAAIAAGADGLMIEVHHKPEEALSDGPQSLNPDNFKLLVDEITPFATLLDKSLQYNLY